MNVRPFAALLFATAIPATAALTWTGGGDGISLYQEANWLDNNNNVPAAGEVNPNTAVTADTGGLIEIAGGAGSPANFGGSFILGTGDSLTVSNGKNLASGGGSPVTGGGAGTTLTVSNGGNLGVGIVSAFDNVTLDNATVNLSGSLTGGGTGTLSITNGSTFASGTVSDFDSIIIDNSNVDLNGSAGFQMVLNPASIFSLSNGATLSTQFVTRGASITVDGSSSIEFLGGGDPINSQTASTTVELFTGGQLIMVSEAEIDEHIGQNEIIVNGTQVTAGNRNSLLSVTGGTAVAIPEPASSLLGGLALLGLFLRRR